MITKMNLFGIDIHSIWIIILFPCFLKTLNKTLFLPVFFAILFDILVADNSLIDRQHLKKYPFCGKMQSPSKASTGRIVNSETVSENYRWVVQLTINNRNANGHLFRQFLCSGTILTER